MELVNLCHYFEIARERYSIRLRREAGLPPPWTDNRVFRLWRFCNVHREHDKTTVWLRNNVRIPLRNAESSRITEAIVAFRWFNRIEIGERIKDLLVEGWDSKEALRRLKSVHPVVTGAYMIRTPEGLDKITGVLHCIDNARRDLKYLVPGWGSSLRDAWCTLKEIDYLGPFLAYEIVTDLRWTKVLQYAQDINTWTNAGPGCTRGLGRVLDGMPQHFRRHSLEDQAMMLGIMIQILETSRHEEFWPQNWVPWELRECEHWACEYDKYVRARGGGQLKQRFRSENENK